MEKVIGEGQIIAIKEQGAGSTYISIGDDWSFGETVIYSVDEMQLIINSLEMEKERMVLFDKERFKQ